MASGVFSTFRMTDFMVRRKKTAADLTVDGTLIARIAKFGQALMEQLTVNEITIPGGLLGPKSITTGHLSDGAVDGFPITGPNIQTDAGSSVGLKLNAGGLYAYDSHGNVTVAISREGQVFFGAGSVDGSSISDGTISPDQLDIDGTVDALTQSKLGSVINVGGNSSVTNAISNAVDPISKDLQQTQQDLSTQRAYFRFEADANNEPVVTLGATKSPSQLRLTNDQIELVNNNVVVSVWNSGVMRVSQMQVESVVIGNHLLQSMGDGDTIIRWVGN